ncbi:hypothetical protein ATE92_1006 [Ulvibacter sp. MAR_2010_11]|uniref:hypothetical protein n=1 Tax=Ulvibacter sp. MAR_2010_11 TaxID=1250229 RepID=UPI000C2C0B6E|nr:hypothetical protein [Ulvibacter sp. MAR_2010_11]PKA82866.1 hypothetical protein ATE92_1006 [Ulvibacter sp. MAR_2010_11]
MKTIAISFKKIAVILCLITVPMLISCKDDAKTKETTTEVTPVKNTTQEKAATPASGEAITINPAHGQPGHRCDLPVGAPLNSEATPTNTNSGSPVIKATGTTGNLNPPHGQPGHRCDINVGDPL